MITELCAVLSFSAINNNDKVGVLFFSDQVEKFIPPKKGKQHILRIIRELLDFKPVSKHTNIGLALEYFNNVVKKRCICFMLSDFIADGYDTALRIAARRHDLIGMHIYDPKEQQLPNVGLIRVVDAETGQLKYLDTSSAKVRSAQKEWFDKNRTYFKSAFAKSGADIISLPTDIPYTSQLLNFFKKRSK